jgi:hypothetical protein
LEDRNRARYPIAAVALTTGAFICIRAARDAAFFSPSGIERLPPMLLMTQVGLTIAAALHVGSMRRWGTRKTRMGAFSIVTALFVLTAPFTSRAHPAIMAIVFPLVPVVFAGLFSSAWLLASDLLEDAGTEVIRRAYVLIGGAGLAGGTIGGLIARSIGDRFGSAVTAGIGAALLLGGTIACHLGHRSHPQDGPSAAVKQKRSYGLKTLMEDRYARNIALVAALGATSSMLIDFQFYASAAEHGTTGTAFFANWALITSFSAIVLQLGFAPILQSRFGITGALLVLPAAIFLGAGSLVFIAAVLLPPLVRLSETALRASIHQTSWEQVFLGYDRESRGPMKVLLDGVVPRISGVAGALVLWGLVLVFGARELGQARWLGAGLLVTAGAWAFFTHRLRAKSPAEAEFDPMIRVPDS